MENRRKHMRIPIEVDVELKSNNNKIIKGLTQNISFSGVLIEFKEDIEIARGDSCTIKLLLQQNAQMEINFECKVIHKKNNSIGLEFISLLGLEGYENFKNLLVYNSPYPEKLIEELESNPGIENRNE